MNQHLEGDRASDSGCEPSDYDGLDLTGDNDIALIQRGTCGFAEQGYYAEQTLEYPRAAGVEPTITDLPPLDEIVSPQIDLGSLGGGLERTKELISESGLEQA